MKLGKILKSWLPLAIVITAISGLIYLAVQQDLRISANDPQIQIAEDASNILAEGKPIDSTTVDIAKSLSAFVIVYDSSGKVVKSSAILDGKIPVLPSGVFSDAKNKELRFTWQPKDKVRIAAVILHFSGDNKGYILVGRSLREIENREDLLLLQIVSAWIVTLIASFASIILLDLLF